MMSVNIRSQVDATGRFEALTGDSANLQGLNLILIGYLFGGENEVTRAVIAIVQASQCF